jgi:hypothetical protein
MRKSSENSVAAACLPALVSLSYQMMYLDHSLKVPSGPHGKSAAVRRCDTNVTVVIAVAQLLADQSLADDPAVVRGSPRSGGHTGSERPVQVQKARRRGLRS